MEAWYVSKITNFQVFECDLKDFQMKSRGYDFSGGVCTAAHGFD